MAPVNKKVSWDEIDELMNQIAELEERGDTRYPGMTYEQGIKAAIEWITGMSGDHPLDEPE